MKRLILLIALVILASILAGGAASVVSDTVFVSDSGIGAKE